MQIGRLEGEIKNKWKKMKENLQLIGKKSTGGKQQQENKTAWEK